MNITVTIEAGTDTAATVDRIVITRDKLTTSIIEGILTVIDVEKNEILLQTARWIYWRAS